MMKVVVNQQASKESTERNFTKFSINNQSNSDQNKYKANSDLTATGVLHQNGSNGTDQKAQGFSDSDSESTSTGSVQHPKSSHPQAGFPENFKGQEMESQDNSEVKGEINNFYNKESDLAENINGDKRLEDNPLGHGFYSSVKSPLTVENDDTESLKQRVRHQVEFYFSRQNFPSDAYMQSQVDTDGYIDINIIAKFNKVKSLTQDLDLIVEAIEESDNGICELNNMKTGIKPAWKKAERTTIMLREVEENVSEEEIKGLFYDFDAESCVVKKDVAGTWYVSFQTEEETIKASEVLLNSKLNEKEIKFRIKNDNYIPAGSNVPMQQNLSAISMATPYGYYTNAIPVPQNNVYLNEQYAYPMSQYYPMYGNVPMNIPNQMQPMNYSGSMSPNSNGYYAVPQYIYPGHGFSQMNSSMNGYPMSPQHHQQYGFHSQAQNSTQPLQQQQNQALSPLQHHHSSQNLNSNPPQQQWNQVPSSQHPDFQEQKFKQADSKSISSSNSRQPGFRSRGSYTGRNYNPNYVGTRRPPNSAAGYAQRPFRKPFHPRNAPFDSKFNKFGSANVAPVYRNSYKTSNIDNSYSTEPDGQASSFKQFNNYNKTGQLESNSGQKGEFMDGLQSNDMEEIQGKPEILGQNIKKTSAAVANKDSSSSINFKKPNSKPANAYHIKAYKKNNGSGDEAKGNFSEKSRHAEPEFKIQDFPSLTHNESTRTNNFLRNDVPEQDTSAERNKQAKSWASLVKSQKVEKSFENASANQDYVSKSKASVKESDSSSDETVPDLAPAQVKTKIREEEESDSDKKTVKIIDQSEATTTFSSAKDDAVDVKEDGVKLPQKVPSPAKPSRGWERPGLVIKPNSGKEDLDVIQPKEEVQVVENENIDFNESENESIENDDEKISIKPTDNNVVKKTFADVIKENKSGKTLSENSTTPGTIEQAKEQISNPTAEERRRKPRKKKKPGFHVVSGGASVAKEKDTSRPPKTFRGSRFPKNKDNGEDNWRNDKRRSHTVQNNGAPARSK